MNADRRDAPKSLLFTSVPPPRAGRCDVEYQRACVASWVTGGFRIVSLNAAEERAAVAELGLPIEITTTGSAGRPSITEFFAEMQKYGAEQFGIINADCRMLSYPGVAAALRGAGDRILLASRVDLGPDGVPSPELEAGFDLFLFSRPILDQVSTLTSQFHIGDPWWDFWLPFAAGSLGWTVSNLRTPLITHKKHDTAWSPALWERNAQCFWSALKVWRSERPDVFSDLDDELSPLWGAEALSQDVLPAFTNRIHRWLDAKYWDPPGGLLPSAPDVSDLLAVYRTHFAPNLELGRLHVWLNIRTAQVAEVREHLTGHIEELRRQLDEVRSSFSWRLTKPIRFISRAFKKKPRKRGTRPSAEPK